jgi:hypothetical protein
VVGKTNVEDLVFYGVVGGVTVLRLVSWPTALLVGTAHALHQRARNAAGRESEEEEALEGIVEGLEVL